MPDAIHAVESRPYDERPQAEHRRPQLAVRPVVVFGIVEYPHSRQQHHRPHDASQIVDADERYGAHEAEVACAEQEVEQHQAEHSHHKPVHGSPSSEVVAHLCAHPSRHGHVAEHHDVEQREEYLEVTLRSHPQLYVGEALEGGHQFEESAEI